MQEAHYFYDFKLDDDNAGFFEIKIESNEIYQNVKFKNGNEIYENPFFLKLEKDQVIAFKKGDGTWVNIKDYKENHYPSSAYPLLLPKVKDRLEYFQINEATGNVEGLTILERAGDTINEYRDQKLLRSFKMTDSTPVEINWGGACSKMRSSFEEALAGSPLVRQSTG